MSAEDSPRRRWKSIVWRIVRLPLVTYLAILLMMMWFENSLILHPTKYPGGFWNIPGTNFEDAWFTAADGTKLHGWFIEHDQPRAVVLFAHGNAGNVTHRDERFFPDPLKFDPERFSPEREREIPNVAYFPFGAGPHACIGKNLAMMEMTIVLAMIAREFSWKLSDGMRSRVEPQALIAIRPKPEIVLVPQVRRQLHEPLQEAVPG